MKKVLLLGGTGAIGKQLSTLLTENGYEVFITSRKQHSGTLHYMVGDAHDDGFLNQCLQTDWDIICDFMSYKTNEFNNRYLKLLNGTRQYVFISSARVYADSIKKLTERSPRLLDVVEDTDYLMTDEYALTKARQEDLLMNSRYRNYTIIRPYITYSENRLQLGVLEKEDWLQRCLLGRSLFFSQDIAQCTTTLTCGYDVARGIAAIVGQEKTLGEVYHITCDNSCQWKDILSIYIETLRKSNVFPQVRMIEHAINLRYKETKYQVKYDRLFNRRFDNSKINNFIDTSTFTSPDLGIARCLESFLQNPKFLSGLGVRREALLDSMSGEYAKKEDFNNIKRYLEYLFCRLVYPSSKL